MKKLTCFVVAILMLSFFGGIKIEASNDTLSFHYTFETPQVDMEEGKAIVTLNGCEQHEINNVVLPVKTARILIPYGKGIKEIEVKRYGKKLLGEYELKKAEPLILNGRKISVSLPKDVKKAYEMIGVYGLRGYNILVINIFPVSYTNGRIYSYSAIDVEIKLKDSKPNPLFRGFAKDREWVSRYIDNPSILETYPVKNVKEQYDYLIVTAEKFRQAFQRFVDYKESRGIKATIVTVEEIKVNDFCWNSTPMFNDTQAQIRNFIRWAYMNWGINYVLLGGDADVMNDSSNIIPARRLYATCVGLPLATMDEELEAYIPSDVYYACLDGSFNEDMDDKWGENATGNDVSNEDEADLFAEVWVGRACVDSQREINNFINKTIAYENDFDDKHLMQVLLLGEYLGFGGEAEWGGNHKDKIKPLIPEAYNITTLYDRNTHWSKSQLAAVINEGVNIVNHDGHGWTTYALKMNNEDLHMLHNDKYFFLYSQTCLAGSFDNWYPEEHYYEDDCFAEHLTLDEHGAFACIMNSRYGLGRENSTDSPGMRYDYSFFKALFQENIKEVGRANHYSKEDNVWRINENGMRWTYYQTNLFGDPQVAIKEPTEIITINVTLLKPTNGIYLLDFGPFLSFINKTVIFGRITIEAAASTEPEGKLKVVRFYINNELKYVDDTPPYSWVWDENIRGNCRIGVEACATNGKCERVEREVFILNL